MTDLVDVDGSVLRLRAPGLQDHSLRRGMRLRIGRHPDNDVVLADASVSRHHARLTWNEHAPRPYVEDLSSKNGVLLDGAPVVDRVYLRAPARITIGRFTLVLEVVSTELLEVLGSRPAPACDDASGSAETVALRPARGPW